MTKKAKTISQYIFFLGLGVFLIWWSLRGLTADDQRQISNALAKGRFGYVLPGLGILLLSHWVRALRWRLIIEPLGYTPSRLNTFFAVMVGYLANQAVPRLGEVLRCSTLTRYEKIPLDKLIGTVILERTVDALCLLLLFIVALFSQPHLHESILQTFFSKSRNTGGISMLLWAGIAIAALGAIIMLWLLVTRKKLSDLILLFKKIALHIWQGFIAIKGLRRPGQFIFLSIALWGLYAACVYVGFLMLEETTQYGFLEALTVLCAGSLGMVATPGGIGAYAFLVQKTMMLYQLNSGLGLALGWLLWLLQTGVVLVTGGLSLVALPVYNKNTQSPNKTGV
jgi:uncharacterized membrane protein YbhN (UPF0104 family)